jgi:hypothetical protein
MINWMKKLYNLSENFNHSSIPSLKEICLNQYELHELEQLKDKYHIYFMVRNPYERFIQDIKAHAQHENESILEIVKSIKQNKSNHPPPFYNAKTRILLRGKNVKILYFDNFENDLKNICNKHNFKIKPEGRKEYSHNTILNKNFENRNILDVKLGEFNYHNMLHYSYFYNQEIIDYVYKIYKNDFVHFKFNKNIGNLEPK